MRKRQTNSVSSTTTLERLGSAAVEFALVAPLFLLLLGGIIEFGQAFQAKHALANAARRGCRTAILKGTTSATVTQEVKTHVASLLDVAQADVTVVISLNGTNNAEISSVATGAGIAVTVSVPFNKVGMGFYSKLFDGQSLSSMSIGERE